MMKNYIVAGGSSGIGLAVCNVLANEGHKVYALARNQRELQTSSNLHFITHDFTDNTNPTFDFPDVIHGLIYCPGTVNLKPFHRISTEEFLNDYRINVEGAIRCLQYFFSALKKSGEGSVVLCSTVAAQTGMNFHSSVAVSKGAIEGLTKSLAAEWAPTIRVNAIAPSLVKTPLTEKLTATEEKSEAIAKRHPLQRIGTAQDIADAATFLLSEKSSWITGQIIHVDGGMSVIR